MAKKKDSVDSSLLQTVLEERRHLFSRIQTKQRRSTNTAATAISVY